MPGSGTRARTWFWLCATAVVGGRTPDAAPQDAGEPWKVRPAARAGLSGRGPVLGDRLGRGFCNVVHGQMSLGGVVSLGYAAELGLLAASPLDRISWQPPGSRFAAGLQSAATPAEVQTVLAEVTRIRPELTAFFGCLYYAALRPAEAVALRATSCALPASGWGQLTLTGSLPRSARAWTGNGTPREPRGLKHRPGGASRTVPIPPQLVRLLLHHLHTYGSAADGRLFGGARARAA